MDRDEGGWENYKQRNQVRKSNFALAFTPYQNTDRMNLCVKCSYLC